MNYTRENTINRILPVCAIYDRYGLCGICAAKVHHNTQDIGDAITNFRSQVWMDVAKYCMSQTIKQFHFMYMHNNLSATQNGHKVNSPAHASLALN